ncbi:hypothetical protein OCU04_003534 [Sclerotinia nivalis]|uniref:Uncharacterized protein n=1 Tax=Sclerotinia nivalis TaxID=352851 RepID=A0A9X0DNB1_9HELO|nr:hypothetical protein OCU04_003534 [Sclerotinia nivalis]
MQDENLHRTQKPKRKETSTILKKSFSCLTSYLTRSQQNPPASPTTKLEESVISTAVQGKSKARRRPTLTGEIIELAGENALTVGVSTATTSVSKPETYNTTPKIIHPCTDTASSFSSTSQLQASMHTHTQQTISQTLDSLSPSTSTDERYERHSINTTTTTPENQKRNMQEMFIKSLISKLTKERREAKLKLRSSRRSRYLAAVKKIVKKGWSTRPQIPMKSQLGRKRKLDEQCS